jgi:large subunit ribosomal protein L4
MADMAETTTTTIDAPAYSAQGTQRERVSLPEALFDGTVNLPVMHQAVKAFLANQRQATSKVKTRAEVSGGNSKPFKQKGTGNARQGSTRAPHFVGGGTVFGPDGRHNYEQKVPRQIRQLARKSAFNARARENALYVIDGFSFDAPKTSRILGLLSALGVASKKTLILTDGVKPSVYLSARNLPNTHVMPYSDASTYHILWSDVVLVESGALGQALEPIQESAATTAAPKKTARKSAAKKTATTDGEAAPAAKKTARKSAAPKKEK